MKRIRYSKYVPEPASEMSMEDLLGALSNYLLQSGFQQQYMDFYDLNDAEQTLENLRQAIAEALLNSDMLDEQMRQQIENMSNEQLEQLIEQLIERMEQENYINVDQPHDPSRSSTVGGQVGETQGQTRFEITDKGLDFLGFARCAICWVRWASPASGVTTRATPRPASKPAARRRPTSSATR
jgi:Ca-activated chloride channel homolog